MYNTLSDIKHLVDLMKKHTGEVVIKHKRPVLFKCSVCGRWMREEHFHLNKDRPSGLSNRCKECTQVYNEKHKEERRLKSAQWRAGRKGGN